MNDGYLAFILSWIILILIFTRWLDFLWADSELARVRKLTCFYFVMFFCTHSVTIPLSSSVTVSLGSIVFVAVVLLYHYRQTYRSEQLEMTAVILFCGVLHAVSYQMFAMDPVLMIIPPLYMIPLMFSVFLVLTTTNIQQMWMMMAGGLVTGEVLHKWLILRSTDYVLIGDAFFRDQLILGLMLISVLFLISRQVLAGGNYIFKGLKKKLSFKVLKRLSRYQPKKEG